jgi:hypothetical protein
MTRHVANTLEVRRWKLGMRAEAEMVAPEALRVKAEAIRKVLRPTRRPLSSACIPSDSRRVAS